MRGTHTLHLSDTVSVERGRHFVKVGGEVRHYRSDGYNHVFPRGQLNFFGAFTGSGIGDVLLGYPTVTLLATNDNPQALRTTAANLFVQDDWRVSTRLTVNAGLRYEFNMPPVDAADRMRIFDLETSHAPARGTERRAAAGSARTGTTSRRGSAPPGSCRDDGPDCCGAATACTTTAARSSRTPRSTSTRRTSPSAVYVPGGPVLPTLAEPVPRRPGLPADDLGELARRRTSGMGIRQQGSRGSRRACMASTYAARVGANGRHWCAGAT